MYRVEQRLRYFGYSSFVKTHDNIVREFPVDGRWTEANTTALRGFFAATHYVHAAYTPGGFGFEGTDSALGKTVSPRDAVASNNNFRWLSAFNAPHMINL